jgi:hypothetical protein
VFLRGPFESGVQIVPRAGGGSGVDGDGFVKLGPLSFDESRLDGLTSQLRRRLARPGGFATKFIVQSLTQRDVEVP